MNADEGKVPLQPADSTKLPDQPRPPLLGLNGPSPLSPPPLDSADRNSRQQSNHGEKTQNKQPPRIGCTKQQDGHRIQLLRYHEQIYGPSKQARAPFQLEPKCKGGLGVTCYVQPHVQTKNI